MGYESLWIAVDSVVARIHLRKPHHRRPLRLAAGLIWIAFMTPSGAFALPTLTPHPNDAGTIWYEEDGIKNGNDDHNHLFSHTVQGSAGENHVHDAFAVWDDRTYRYGVGAKTFENGRKADFWHGFIKPGWEPRYEFMDGKEANTTFDAVSKGLIADGVKEWRSAAKAVSAGKATPDGTAVVTELNLLEATEHKFEFRIGFFDGLAESETNGGRGAYAEWLVSKEQIWATAGFDANVLNSGPILAFDDDTDWLFDWTKKPAGDQVDFFTIALHELGHVFGLLHAPGNPDGNLMRADIWRNATDGNTLRAIDINSAYGAAELYTQPVPEPESYAMMLAGLGLLGIVARRRKQKLAT